MFAFKSVCALFTIGLCSLQCSAFTFNDLTLGEANLKEVDTECYRQEGLMAFDYSNPTSNLYRYRASKAMEKRGLVKACSAFQELPYVESVDLRYQDEFLEDIKIKFEHTSMPLQRFAGWFWPKIGNELEGYKTSEVGKIFSIKNSNYDVWFSWEKWGDTVYVSTFEIKYLKHKKVSKDPKNFQCLDGYCFKHKRNKKAISELMELGFKDSPRYGSYVYKENYTMAGISAKKIEIDLGNGDMFFYSPELTCDKVSKCLGPDWQYVGSQIVKKDPVDSRQLGLPKDLSYRKKKGDAVNVYYYKPSKKDSLYPTLVCTMDQNAKTGKVEHMRFFKPW